MADERIQQSFVEQFKLAYPELANCSDEEIITIYNQESIKLSENQKISIMYDKNTNIDNAPVFQIEASSKTISKDREELLKNSLLQGLMQSILV